ncbi:MAG: sensor histidine kinase, partial [Firmicutes bacterium]|nr:sensor histidine kinase [Bacillota bacterium]
ELAVTCSTDGVQVLVKDTGMGIEGSESAKIFERFYRSDKSRPVGGTGLGLSIAKWIAQQHGASITVESELQKGSVFKVTFFAVSEKHGQENERACSTI